MKHISAVFGKNLVLDLLLGTSTAVSVNQKQDENQLRFGANFSRAWQPRCRGWRRIF